MDHETVRMNEKNESRFLSKSRHHVDAILNRERYFRTSPAGNGGSSPDVMNNVRQRNENEAKSSLGKRRFQEEQTREVDDENPRRTDQSPDKGE